MILFAPQGDTILARPVDVARIALPLLAYFAAMWAGGFALGALLGLPYERTATLAFTAAGNNFELAIAVAVAAFGVASGQALAGVVGPLIEVPVLVGLVYVALAAATGTGPWNRRDNGRKAPSWPVADVTLKSIPGYRLTVVLSGHGRSCGRLAMAVEVTEETFDREVGASGLPVVVEVTEETFDREVGASGLPVVVEFFATWCGNCRRVAPVLDVLAAEFAGTVKFVTVDAERSPALVARFGVSSTPTLVVLDRGRQAAGVVGAQPEAVLRGLFELAAGRARPGLAWVAADACTLPSVDRPARLAEFEGLFGSLRGLRREEPRWLRLRLDDADGVEERARDLTAREAACCSFFSFEVHREPGQVVVDVRVPEDRIVVLDGLAAQAQAAQAARA